MFVVFILTLIVVYTQFGRGLTENLLHSGDGFTPDDLEDLERHLEERLAELEERLEQTEVVLTRERNERELGG